MPNKNSSTVILSEDGKRVLLQLREDFRLWSLPGGRVERGETVEQAAIREAFEETGYHIELDRLVGEYRRPNKRKVKYLFLGHVIGGSPIENGPETIRVEWFPVDALPTPLVHPQFMYQYIHDALAPTKQPVQRVQRLSVLATCSITIRMFFRDVRNFFTRRP